MKEREIVGIVISKHNELAESHTRLINKHNRLCKAVVGLSLVCIGLDVMIYFNAREISKLKTEKEKETKEG